MLDFEKELLALRQGENNKIADFSQFLKDSDDFLENVAQLLKMKMKNWTNFSDCVEFLHKHEGIEPSHQLHIAVSCLLVYCQANFFGPTLLPNNSKFEQVWVPIQQDLMSLLSVDGEVYHSKASHSEYLLTAFHLFNSLSSQFLSAHWWICRYVSIHSSNLLGKSATLYNLFINHSQLFNNSFNFSNISIDLIIKLKLEMGMFWSNNWNTTKSLELFNEAKEISGLCMELSGRLGVRTKFQEHQVSLLVLEASSKQEYQSSSSSLTIMPHYVENEDELLLDKSKFQEPRVIKNLQPYDQAILLSFYCHVKSDNPKHQITNDEMMAYVSRVEENPNHWLIHATALILKTKLEAHSMRTHLRAVSQLESLFKEFWQNPTPLPYLRCEWLFCVPLPIHWQLGKDLAYFRISMGEFASAIQLFEKLELWEEVVDCYKLLNRPKVAEELILQRLKVNETPQLYCSLADVTENIQFYYKAWELSKNRFPRAQRSLARHHLHLKEYKEAAEHFELALAINPLYADQWFSLGACYLHLENWKRGAECFTFVVRLMPDSGESWANLSMCHLQNGNLKEAFSALSEATKHKESSFHIWDNLLSVSMQLGEFQKAMYAVQRVMELSPDKTLDVNVLATLAKIVIEDIPDINQVGGKAYKNRFDQLMLFIENSISDAKVWGIFALYCKHFNQIERAIDFLEKKTRALQKPQWYENPDLFKQMAESILDLCELYFIKGGKECLFSAELKVNGTIKKCKDQFSETEEFKKLQDLFIKITKEQSKLPSESENSSLSKEELLFQ